MVNHAEAEISYRGFDQVLMNVGSVGQPRDEDPRAAYGLVDTDVEIACVKRVHYDIAGRAAEDPRGRPARRVGESPRPRGLRAGADRPDSLVPGNLCSRQRLP
jgi:diadenosine tetraphosphatase ApaH/serine/threonine PP2A family protein phosphatase